MYSNKRLSTLIEEPLLEELLGKRWEDYNFPPEFLSKNWSSFDHSQSLFLGRKFVTWVVHERESNKDYILQSCAPDATLESRLQLLQLACTRMDLFITPHYLFTRKNRLYVCSENHEPGICLRDLIQGIAPITEAQATAVIKQVVAALKEVEKCGLVYNALTPSNIFVSRKGYVRLAAFGCNLRPHPYDRYTDSESVAHLAYYMLTRRLRIPRHSEGPVAPGHMLTRTKLGDFEIEIDRISAELFDFIDYCLANQDLESVSKHMIFWDSEKTHKKHLMPLLPDAERTALRECRRRVDCGSDLEV